MNKIKEILNNKIYWICVIISMCFFGIFAIPNSVISFGLNLPDLNLELTKSAYPELVTI